VRLGDPSLQPPQPRPTPGASRVAPSTSRARWRHTHGCESARTTGSPATRSSLSSEVHKLGPATSPGQAKWEQATLDADERGAAPTALQPAPPSGRPRASSATPPRPPRRAGRPAPAGAADAMPDIDGAVGGRTARTDQSRRLARIAQTTGRATPYRPSCPTPRPTAPSARSRAPPPPTAAPRTPASGRTGSAPTSRAARRRRPPSTRTAASASQSRK
jgi:hypothetical protein